jgi:allophanate hydrolase subunit 2
MRSLTVLRTGPQALVQDAGRPGFAHLGVPPSGAVDLPALAMANALVGNPAGAAGIEAVLGGVVLRASCPCTIAVTGAPARVRLGSARHGAAGGTGEGLTDLDFATAIQLSPGDELRVGTPRAALRCYLAVSGGLAVPVELGSRSTDVLSGIGPPPLSAGQVLPLGDATPSISTHAAPPAHAAAATLSTPGTPDTSGTPGAPDAPAAHAASPAHHAAATPSTPGTPDAPAHGDGVRLPVLLGPRDDWFADAAEQLTAGEWTVSPTSNRIGVRLDGTKLRRRHDGELPTEPVVTGAVQVPPSGEPVIFLNDHPTTGGYPVIAVVHPDALPLLAQARPGSPVRLRPSM